jgi:hypothetical protein
MPRASRACRAERPWFLEMRMGEVPDGADSHSSLKVSCSAYSSTLKMEAICSSKTSVDFQRTIRRYIPEHGILHNHRYENLNCYTFIYTFTCLTYVQFVSNPLNVAQLL